MSIEPREVTVLQWYQFRLSFLLLLVPFIALIASLFLPMASIVGHWYAGPDTGGKAHVQQRSPTDPVFEVAFRVVMSQTNNSAKTTSLDVLLTEKERTTHTKYTSPDQPQTLRSDLPGG